MYELLEYLIAIGGSVVLFFITKSTNMGAVSYTHLTLPTNSLV